MGRRGHRPEMEFGSDSFLDVIANIVGILIILIVIAGLRVGQSPKPTISEEDVKAASLLALDDVRAAGVAADEMPEDENEPGDEEEVADVTDADLEPSPALAQRMKDLESEIAALDEDATKQESEVEEIKSLQAFEKRELSETEKALAAHDVDHRRMQRRLNRLSQTIAERKDVLAQLITQIDELKKVAPPVKKVQHKVTPIARSVQGDEVHFRLSEGKVSVVPLTELVDRLLKQAERQKEWLAQYHRHEGTVGPVNGFTMNYIIERQPVSVTDAIHRGPGAFRVGVTAFRVNPEPDLKAETIEQAIKVGSEFHIALQTAKPGSTLTFWVYPDSYALYRRLQSISHGAGFTVAARPLPEGVPIAGSPNGTRSAGQ